MPEGTKSWRGQSSQKHRVSQHPRNPSTDPESWTIRKWWTRRDRPLEVAPAKKEALWRGATRPTKLEYQKDHRREQDPWGADQKPKEAEQPNKNKTTRVKRSREGIRNALFVTEHKQHQR